MSSATLFNPTDSSLEAKIHAARQVLHSLQMLEASQQHLQVNGPDSVLGTEEELDIAQALTNSSFHDAVNSLSMLELQHAHTQQYLSLDEYHYLMTAKQNAQLREAQAIHSKDLDRDR